MSPASWSTSRSHLAYWSSHGLKSLSPMGQVTGIPWLMRAPEGCYGERTCALTSPPTTRDSGSLCKLTEPRRLIARPRFPPPMRLSARTRSPRHCSYHRQHVHRRAPLRVRTAGLMIVPAASAPCRKPRRRNNVHAYMDRIGGADNNIPDTAVSSVLTAAASPSEIRC